MCIITLLCLYIQIYILLTYLLIHPYIYIYTPLQYINQSLLTLSTIIQRLSEDALLNNTQKKQHLPYRDSKLTRLMQSSLSGNSNI